MCDCHSYNGQTGSTPEVVATPPWSNKTVCLDACIADAIQLLWSLGYVTAGCCCGHGETEPHVILADHNSEDAPVQVAKLLEEVDGRPWRVGRWELVWYDAAIGVKDNFCVNVIKANTIPATGDKE